MLQSETFLLQVCFQLASPDPLPAALGDWKTCQAADAHSIASTQLKTSREFTRLILLESGYLKVETGGLCINGRTSERHTASSS